MNYTKWDLTIDCDGDTLKIRVPEAEIGGKAIGKVIEEGGTLFIDLMREGKNPLPLPNGPPGPPIEPVPFKLGEGRHLSIVVYVPSRIGSTE